MLTYDFNTVAKFVNAATERENPLSTGTAIGWLRDEELVAGVLYEDFTGEGGSISAHIAVAPGAVMSREFTWAVFTYPFKQLRVAKIFAMVSNINWKSVRLVNHMGFTEAAVIPGYYPDSDLIVYEMTADKCRWLEA